MKMFAPAQKMRSFRLVMTTARTSGCSKRMRCTRVRELDVDAEIVRIQLEPVVRREPGVLLHVHRQRGDGAVERQLPVAISLGRRFERNVRIVVSRPCPRRKRTPAGCPRRNCGAAGRLVEPADARRRPAGAADSVPRLRFPTTSRWWKTKSGWSATTMGRMAPRGAAGSGRATIRVHPVPRPGALSTRTPEVRGSGYE